MRKQELYKSVFLINDKILQDSGRGTLSNELHFWEPNPLKMQSLQSVLWHTQNSDHQNPRKLNCGRRLFQGNLASRKRLGDVEESNFLKSEKIELGGMHQSLLLANGKTAKRVKILGLLQSFLVSRFPNLLEEKTLSELKSLVLDYRNEAAHERSFDHSELKFVRSQTIGLLKVILGLRSISSNNVHQ